MNLGSSLPPFSIGFSRNEHIEVELERLLQVCWPHVQTLLLQEDPIPPLPQQLRQISTNATSYVKVSVLKTPSNANMHSKSNASSLKAHLHAATSTSLRHRSEIDSMHSGLYCYTWQKQSIWERCHRRRHVADVNRPLSHL